MSKSTPTSKVALGQTLLAGTSARAKPKPARNAAATKRKSRVFMISFRSELFLAGKDHAGTDKIGAGGSYSIK